MVGHYLSDRGTFNNIIYINYTRNKLDRSVPGLIKEELSKKISDRDFDAQDKVENEFQLFERELYINKQTERIKTKIGFIKKTSSESEKKNPETRRERRFAITQKDEINDLIEVLTKQIDGNILIILDSLNIFLKDNPTQLISCINKIQQECETKVRFLCCSRRRVEKNR
eukprot:UN22578